MTGVIFEPGPTSKPIYLLCALSKQGFYVPSSTWVLFFWLTRMIPACGDMTTLCLQYDLCENFPLVRYFIAFYRCDVLHVLEQFLKMTKPFLTA